MILKSITARLDVLPNGNYDFGYGYIRPVPKLE